MDRVAGPHSAFLGSDTAATSVQGSGSASPGSSGPSAREREREAILAQYEFNEPLFQLDVELSQLGASGQAVPGESVGDAFKDVAEWPWHHKGLTLLTIANIIQLGADPITDSAEGVDLTATTVDTLSDDSAGDAAAPGAKPGWSTGDDVYSLTRAGNRPSWSTVRSRFWKNEAADPQYGSWSEGNIARMERGLAPQRYNPDKGGIESMELSHEPIPYRDGGTEVIPRWPQDHAAVDPYRHPGY